MQSFREPAANTVPQPNFSALLPPSPLLVSMASAPLLAGVITGNWVLQGLIELGISSEELFRGDRLPTLPPLTPSETTAIDTNS